jgi:hypothetical protein
VITGLLQRSPEARLSGMQAQALLASADGEPPPEGPTAPLPAPARSRRPWVVGIAAALVVGLVAGLLGGYALAGAGGPDVRTLTYGAGGEVPVFDVTYLNCLTVAPAPGRQVVSSATQTCDDPHPAELFAAIGPFTAQYALAYPRDFAAFAARACALAYSSDVVVGADKDALDVIALYPTQAEFERNTSTSGSARFGGRVVHCVLAAPDGGQLEGTRLRDLG